MTRFQTPYPRLCTLSSDVHHAISAAANVQAANEQDEPHLPATSNLSAIAQPLYQALYDYAPTEPRELAFLKGDLIECLDADASHNWFRGKIYSGRPNERVGLCPTNYVSKVDPTDPIFHDALARISGGNQHAKLKSSDAAEATLPSLEIDSGDVIKGETRKDLPHAEDDITEDLQGMINILQEHFRVSMNTPTEREVLCMRYIRGPCRNGNACRFSHKLNARVCQRFLTGTCMDSSCTLLHFRFPRPIQEEDDGPKMKPQPQQPSLVTEPIVLGSIARQDSGIRPDLLLPPDDGAPAEFGTIGEMLKNNPNYGPKSRSFLPSPSVPLQQLRENKQRTPPIPSEPSKVELNTGDGLADAQARCLQLTDQIFDAGKADLFYTLTRSHDSTQPKTAVLNVAALQHMALHQLQYDISCYVGEMYRTSRFYMELRGFPPLEELMNDYCDTIRNLDLMKQCATRGYEEDRFLMKFSRALERSILEATKLIPNHVLPSGPLPLPKDYDNPQLRDMGRNEANKAAYQKSLLLRFIMAGAGALLLVVPMLIMANIAGKTASLITTCISLLLFSALIPLVTELKPNEILATTAAYAAVLVVFVGTSLSSSTVVDSLPA